MEGLGTFIIRLDTRVRRLGTSGFLRDTRLDQNLTDWQTGLGLGWTGGIIQKDWDRTGPRTGLGMIDWSYQTGANPIRTGRLNGTDSPSPAPKLDWDLMQDMLCLVVHSATAAELRTLHRN